MRGRAQAFQGEERSPIGSWTPERACRSLPSARDNWPSFEHDQTCSGAALHRVCAGLSPDTWAKQQHARVGGISHCLWAVSRRPFSADIFSCAAPPGLGRQASPTRSVDSNMTGIIPSLSLRAGCAQIYLKADATAGPGPRVRAAYRDSGRCTSGLRADEGAD